MYTRRYGVPDPAMPWPLFLLLCRWVPRHDAHDLRQQMLAVAMGAQGMVSKQGASRLNRELERLDRVVNGRGPRRGFRVNTVPLHA